MPQGSNSAAEEDKGDDFPENDIQSDEYEVDFYNFAGALPGSDSYEECKEVQLQIALRKSMNVFNRLVWERLGSKPAGFETLRELESRFRDWTKTPRDSIREYRERKKLEGRSDEHDIYAGDEVSKSSKFLNTSRLQRFADVESAILKAGLTIEAVRDISERLVVIQSGSFHLKGDEKRNEQNFIHNQLHELCPRILDELEKMGYDRHDIQSGR